MSARGKRKWWLMGKGKVMSFKEIPGKKDPLVMCPGFKRITRCLIIYVSMAFDVCISFYCGRIGQFASENVDFSEVLSESCVRQS